MKTNNLFFVELTDTYGGDANYSWVKRFMVTATTMRGAISKVTRETGYHAKKDYVSDNLARYNVPGAALCYFVSETDSGEREQYSKIKDL